MGRNFVSVFCELKPEKKFKIFINLKIDSLGEWGGRLGDCILHGFHGSLVSHRSRALDSHSLPVSAKVSRVVKFRHYRKPPFGWSAKQVRCQVTVSQKWHRSQREMWLVSLAGDLSSGYYRATLAGYYTDVDRCPLVRHTRVLNTNG